MKKPLLSAFALSLALAVPLSFAQEAKPYKEGPVSVVSSIRVKPGQFDNYMKFLDTQYKALMEAYKKEGLVLRYSVYSVMPRSPQDPNLYLTVTYPNMAALDKVDEADAIMTKVAGSSDARAKANADRGAMREVLGSQMIRELVLK